ncbi:MAG TPA: hypothetical protein VFN44_11395 [Solirubrobacteraceae bacterium]|nr:hypothetical protein [Solirubrobacteraceae bacterium]
MVKIAYPFLLLALLVPATASAQTPPPDEPAAAQALADAATRLIRTAEGIEEELGWTGDCRALEREPPARRQSDATAYAEGLIQRDYLDELRPAVAQLRSDIANVHTADPVLISGRASMRQLLRKVTALPAGEDDPCAAYEAYARAGYPRGPAREARALERRLTEIATRGMKRKIVAAAARMVELGVSRADVRDFRDLAG